MGFSYDLGLPIPDGFVGILLGVVVVTLVQVIIWSMRK